MIKKQNEYDTETRTGMRGGNGEVKFEHIWKPGAELNGHCRLYSKINLKPGSSIGWHVHENEEEIFYILKGTAEADDNGVKTTLHAGDSMVTRSGEGHSIAAAGDSDVEILAVIGTY